MYKKTEVCMSSAHLKDLKKQHLNLQYLDILQKHGKADRRKTIWKLVTQDKNGLDLDLINKILNQNSLQVGWF